MTDEFPFPYTHKDSIQFIKVIANSGDNIDFAIEIIQRAVGNIGIHPQKGIMRKNAELEYWLEQKYWGQGIISEAVKEMVRFAFENYDIIRLYARPFGTNTASQSVLVKNGFKLEARIEKNIFKNGEYIDELIYAVRK